MEFLLLKIFLKLFLIIWIRFDLSEGLDFGYKFLGWLLYDDSYIQTVCFAEGDFSSLSGVWKIFKNNLFSFLLLFPKIYGGIEEVSLMGMVKGLNKNRELSWGIFSTLEDSNE